MTREADYTLARGWAVPRGSNSYRQRVRASSLLGSYFEARYRGMVAQYGLQV